MHNYNVKFIQYQCSITPKGSDDDEMSSCGLLSKAKLFGARVLALARNVKLTVSVATEKWGILC